MSERDREREKELLRVTFTKLLGSICNVSGGTNILVGRAADADSVCRELRNAQQRGQNKQSRSAVPTSNTVLQHLTSRPCGTCFSPVV